MTREDIEMALLREFSIGGIVLAHRNRAEMMEQVRVAIHKSHAPGTRFYDTDMSYAQAYLLWAGRPLELRLKPRTKTESDFDGDQQTEK